VKRRFVPFPISMVTLEMLFDRTFDEASMGDFIEERRLPLTRIENSRDVVLAQVGEELYDLFVRDYTRKQWGLGAEELDPSVLRRVPLRFNRDVHYFSDPHQGLPVGGFTALIARVLDHPRISLKLSTPYDRVRASLKAALTLYTGRLDEFFDYRFGVLPYRSLRFRLYEVERPRVFPAGVVNFPGPEPFTRVSEYKTLYRQDEIRRTLLAVETPQAEGEPYYPIPGLKNRDLVARYQALAEQQHEVLFAGRLGGYRYLNMDQAANEGLERGDDVVRRLSTTRE
jgi:UDP-galactopyranose mutase